MRVGIDGLDGTGKTTVAKKLEKELGLRYVHFPTKRFPKGFEKLPPEDVYEFFVKDFEEWISKNGCPDNVVFDRSFVSTLLYQSIPMSRKLGLSIEEVIDWIVKDITSRIGMLPLDRIFIFTADVDVALERLGSRKRTDELFEKKDFLNTVLKNVPTTAKKLSELGYTVEVIDTTDLDIETLFKVVLNALEEG